MTNLATIPGAHLVAKINSAHRQAFGNAKKAMEYAAECGRLLLEAKELVEHGEWVPWLEAHTEVGPRQSQKYMRLAQNWAEIESKNDLESYLGIEDALKLVAKPRAASEPAPKPGSDEYERDRKECVALWQKTVEAEAEATAARDKYIAQYGVDPRTVERAIAKAEGKVPKPKAQPVEPEQPAHSCGGYQALDFARAAAKNARETAAVLRENEDALEIDDDLIRACEAVSAEWGKLAVRLTAKRASTLPQDGSSEFDVDDYLLGADDDLGDVPDFLQRKTPH